MKLIYFIYGTCFSSFICLIGCRIPRGENVISPRSHCDNCSYNLQWFELIPIIGYLINLGRCRKCKIQVPLFFPANEFLLGIFFALFVGQTGALFKILIAFLLLLFSTMDYLYGIIMPIFFVPFIIILLLISPQLYCVNSLIFFAILSIFSYLSKGLGFGDVEVITFLALFFSGHDCLSVILIACLLCIIIEVFRQSRKISFVPYLYFATILLLLFQY